jgi:NADPH-dependent glutamate synthase beta subunit-like oxidoreductase
MDNLYRDMERRVTASPPGLCPIDMAKAFVNLCHAQSCGKCVPCRVGLGQLSKLIGDVLDGKATLKTLDVLEETALTIMNGADCEIGYEAAEIIYKGLTGYRYDYIEHIENGRCSCSFDTPVPCVSQCPAHVDIPGYVALTGAGRYEDAIRLIRKDNPFPAACGYICEHPCEAKCRRNMLEDAVNIRGIKRFASDMAGEVAPPACAPSTGKKVAIIGGGPTGLSAAYFLQLMGHQTTIFEMLPELGGMLRYGIPNYRLPKDVLDRDINVILQTGVEVKHGIKIGKDITFAQLREEYDAVLLSIGASTHKSLRMENEDAKGVISAVELLRNVGLKQPMDLTGQEVIIVGGGNVAMDAARSAKRLGAKKVTIAYRRRIADMTALAEEIEGAIAEGIEVQTLRAPASIVVDENHHITGLNTTAQMVSYIRNGRASVKECSTGHTMIPCDTLVLAIGQDIESQHYAESGIPIVSGRSAATPTGAIAGMPDVFSAGDCESGPATVIKAIAAAKVTAANIDEFLGFHHEISCDVELPPASLHERKPCGRINMTEREPGERVNDFEGIEHGMSEAEMKQECSRCLQCDHFGYGSFRGGREKAW